MQRLKWIRDEQAGHQTTADGRFLIRTVCMNPKWQGYWGLTDTTTGEEFPCRTEASAKVAARNLQKQPAH
jgi:hypothetical protein